MGQGVPLLTGPMSHVLSWGREGELKGRGRVYPLVSGPRSFPWSRGYPARSYNRDTLLLGTTGTGVHPAPPTGHTTDSICRGQYASWIFTPKKNITQIKRKLKKSPFYFNLSNYPPLLLFIRIITGFYSMFSNPVKNQGGGRFCHSGLLKMLHQLLISSNPK